MTPHQYQRLTELFHAALEIAPDERAAFLNQAAGGDSGLRREVESLLALHERRPDYTVTPPADIAAGFYQARQDRQDGDAARISLIAPNTRLGRYEIRSLLGKGGMGEVYLADDKKMGRRVALKVLSSYFTQDSQRVRRFKQEAQAIVALNHPNIVTVYDIGQAEDIYFIATELIEGETLRRRASNGELKLSETIEVAIQVTSALVAAHQAGVVHRDIKPDNIMVRTDGYVKVLDFGLAKLFERSHSASTDSEVGTLALVQTEAGVVMGTASYMSPEQARGSDMDARTDIWSLGVVLYELTAGRLPFEGATQPEAIARIIEREPVPLARYAPGLPAELERIVTKALTKDREERYQTAKDLLIDLKRLKQRLEVDIEIERIRAPEGFVASTAGEPDTIVPTALPVTGTNNAYSTSSAEYVVTGIKSHKLAAVAALVIVAAAAAGLWWYFHLRNTGVAIDSIAVLPFVNASDNADIEYLSDGITESLIISLSQLPHLSVKGRSSVFRYKGKQVEPQVVASELSVQAVLNGRVVQRGDDLTLYLSLVDASNGNQVWGDEYHRKLSDLVVLQQEIAHDVSQKLRVRLSGPEEQKLAKNYTENPEAYQLYLQGLYHWNKLSPPEIRKSLEYFQRAIDVDPNYALAYADLGRDYFSLAIVADAPSQEAFPKAREAAEKALKIDDTLAQAHTTLGWVKFWFDWDWNGAEQEFQRAMSLDSTLADTHIAYANLLTFTGRHGEALSQAQRARESEPLNLRINALEGQTLFYAGKYDEAVVRLRKTIELEPTFFLSHLALARVYMEKTMYLEAVGEAIKARDFSGGHSEAVAHLIYALAKSGRREEAQTELNELKKRIAEGRYVPPYNLALAYHGLGKTDEAIAWLEKGVQQRDIRMAFLKVEPKWNNLRSDRRFADLVRRMGF